MNQLLVALLGGGLIGSAAVLLMALEGRIAGVSGIVGGLLPPRPAPDRAWRVAFMVGLVAGPLIVGSLLSVPVIGLPEVGPGLALLAGLLVGLGTALGSGCTSGHGVCGLARLSPRSLVATVVFVVTAIITVLLVRHLL